MADDGFEVVYEGDGSDMEESLRNAGLPDESVQKLASSATRGQAGWKCFSRWHGSCTREDGSKGRYHYTVCFSYDKDGNVTGESEDSSCV